MSNKKGHTDLNTGHQVIDFARKRNAHIEKAGSFVSIETRRGKMHIVDNNVQMDKQTKSNVKKWLRLLGLMLFLFLCVYPIFIRL